MAEGGGPPGIRGPPQEDEFLFDEDGEGDSEIRSLKGPFETPQKRASSSRDDDEGCPISPDQVMTPDHLFLVRKQSAKIEEMEKTIMRIIESLSNLTSMTEEGEKEKEDCRKEKRGMQATIHKLAEEASHATRDRDQIKQKLQAMQEQMEKELKDKQDGVKDLIRAHETIRCQSVVIDQRALEFSAAIDAANRERDSLNARFHVTVVQLREQKQENRRLLMMLEQYEERCQKLERENQQLRDFINHTSFSQESSELECFSCKQNYSTSRNFPGSCTFHPLPSMPYESWRNCHIANELPPGRTPANYRNYYYWACCNTLASRRPDGCCHGRHHQQWEMDIVMRQALVDDNISFTDEQDAPIII